jgi:hypothetical protein
MVLYGDSTVYYSRIGERHLRYPGKLRRPWLRSAVEAVLAGTSAWQAAALRAGAYNRPQFSST